MQKTAVINVVGLTQELIGQHTPFLARWASQGKTATVQSTLPAVTCTMQSCYLTGKWPDEHGIVANGWYFREECEVKFWRQSNKLVTAPKIWEIARQLDPSFSCNNLFWWYNMYSNVDGSVTPRPIYAADGRKFPDCYTQPAELRDKLQQELGSFPLFHFWGPKTSISASQWIAEAAKRLEQWQAATLSLVYLPHLDYCLQRLGPNDPAIAKDLQEIDAVCQDLVNFYEQRGIRVIILSEYGITPVNQAVALNRVLRAHGYIKVREERGGELLDPGASKAFAVADHQVAHIYIQNPEDIAKVRAIIEAVPGVEQVLGQMEKRLHHLDHPRSGELIAIADPQSWFSYYYWQDDKHAPDFARTVEIHRKPGYDPAELFVDPTIKLAKLKLAAKLLKKKLGFRYLLDFIPLDAGLVKGSHGRASAQPGAAPLLISQQRQLIPDTTLAAPEVFHVIMAHLDLA
jgi:predicted AlkP superfamily pyrophosphatase or phosphodiesterase